MCVKCLCYLLYHCDLFQILICMIPFYSKLTPRARQLLHSQASSIFKAMLFLFVFAIAIVMAASSGPSDPLLLRGGRLQRKRNLQDAQSSRPSTPEAPPPKESELGAFLIEEWSWGFLSAARCQQFAWKAHQDQCSLLNRLGPVCFAIKI